MRGLQCSVPSFLQNRCDLAFGVHGTFYTFEAHILFVPWLACNIAIVDRDAVSIHPLLLGFGEAFVSCSYANGVNLTFLILPTVLQIDVCLCLIDLAIFELTFLGLARTFGEPVPVLLLHHALVVEHQRRRASREGYTKVDILIRVCCRSDRFDIAPRE